MKTVLLLFNLGFVLFHLSDSPLLPRDQIINGRKLCSYPAISYQIPGAYGFAASPDGKRFACHSKEYKLLVCDLALHCQTLYTGMSFNFMPKWRPDGKELLFVGGKDNFHANVYVINPDGSGLQKIADRNGYIGQVYLFKGDTHGSSDTPAWSEDGKWIYYTAQVVELFRASESGLIERLSFSNASVQNYFPAPPPDGAQLAFGSNREGRPQIYTLNLESGKIRKAVETKENEGAAWPFWR